jgi:hypothetical protein
MWNERHGKHNWNKDKFKVYLEHHLKEVAILPDPHLNFLQIVWTKNKANIENWMTASKTTQWLWNGHKLSLQKANPSTLATTEMQGLTIAPCFWITHVLWTV